VARNAVSKHAPVTADSRKYAPQESASIVRCRRVVLVAARVVRAAVLGIANTIAIAVAIRAIRHAITVTISMMHAAIPDRNFVGNTAGQQTADGDQQNNKLFHIISWTK